jgi:hypothetical protein
MNATINGKPAMIMRQHARVRMRADVAIVVNGLKTMAHVIPPRTSTNYETGEVTHLKAQTVFQWHKRQYYFIGDARNMGLVTRVDFDPLNM